MSCLQIEVDINLIGIKKQEATEWQENLIGNESQWTVIRSADLNWGNFDNYTLKAGNAFASN